MFELDTVPLPVTILAVLIVVFGALALDALIRTRQR